MTSWTDKIPDINLPNASFGFNFPDDIPPVRDVLSIAMVVGQIPAWILLIFAPRSQLTRKATLFTLSMLSLAYIVLLYEERERLLSYFQQPISSMKDSEGGIASTEESMSLYGYYSKVYELFSYLWQGTDILIADYLVSRLGVGLWLSMDSKEKEIHPILMVPHMIMASVIGPVSALLYVCFTRPVLRRSPEPERGLPRHKLD